MFDLFDDKLDIQIERMIQNAKIEDVLSSNIHESVRLEEERRQMRSKVLKEKRQRELV